MKHQHLGNNVARHKLIEWYRSGRARSTHIFDIPVADAYYERPIPLRNPIGFYEEHIPAFAVNRLIKLALGERVTDEHYESLFRRGGDPGTEAAVKNPTDPWPR